MCGPNDGGIKRGDRAATGDDRAGPTDGVGVRGSGVPGGDGASGNVTAEPNSLAEPVSGIWVDSNDVLEQLEESEGFEIADASDPVLGFTNVPGHPPEDWAADTGLACDQSQIAEIQPPPE